MIAMTSVTVFLTVEQQIGAEYLKIKELMQDFFSLFSLTYSHLINRKLLLTLKN